MATTVCKYSYIANKSYLLKKSVLVMILDEVMNMDVVSIGRFLCETRKFYRLTQEELAIKLSVSRQAISKWETGVALPDIETFFQLSKLYGMTVNDMIEADLRKIHHRISPIRNDNSSKSKKIIVIGCGRWGTFIGWYLDRIGHDVTIYGRNNSQNMKRLTEERSNEYISLGDSINLTNSLEEAIESDIIIISINSQGLKTLIDELADLNLKQKRIVLCMKGIDISSGRRLSQIVDDGMNHTNKTAVWLGPGHVEDFYTGIPNCMVIDSIDEMVKKEIVDIFSSDLIRFYFGMDVVGNEIGAAAKNVIGIAAGMLDALNRSALKGALMTRGPREIARLIKAMGGNELTAYGLCHLGDYEATLFSEHSHNRLFGEKYILKQPYDKLAEGYYTVKALINLGKNYGVDLPICNAIFSILYCDEDAEMVLDRLFKRSLKEEFM